MAIGGFFELELPQGNEYHEGAIKLNSGRHCLEYILRLREYRKVFIPYYTCDVVLQPIQKLGLSYEFYKISEKLEPIFSFEALVPDECFLYTNYFGLKDKYIQALPKLPNIIIDNSQAFFAKPLPGFDTFYSPRKFFGVPDGGYLFTYDKSTLDSEFPQARSYDRFAHLLKRIDLSAEAGYTDFQANDSQVSAEAIMQMSKLSRRILSSINYEQVSRLRTDNFKRYHEHLKQINLFPADLFEDIGNGPLVYPLLSDNKKLRENLISKKIYVAQYWPNVLQWSSSDSLECKLAHGIVSLPIDQRMDEDRIKLILKEI